VKGYLWENKQHFACVSFLPRTGDKIYNQAPFTSVLSEQQLVEKYSSGAILGSGLVVDALEYFTNLWDACEYILQRDLKLVGTRKELLLKRDWLKRAKIFAKRYCKGNLELTTFCLKDIYLYHKWCNVNRVLSQKDIDLSKAPEIIRCETALLFIPEVPLILDTNSSSEKKLPLYFLSSRIDSTILSPTHLTEGNDQ